VKQKKVQKHKRSHKTTAKQEYAVNDFQFIAHVRYSFCIFSIPGWCHMPSILSTPKYEENKLQ
jgi:hypothetical protein